MSVSGTDKSYSSGLIDTSSITRKPTQQLGQDAFLQILVAQMANQDPMEPMKDTEFIAQMAQFSALEQMQALNQSFMNSQAHGMVGRFVVASTYVENKETGNYEKIDLKGVVSGVQNVNGKTYLILGEYLVDPSSVSESYEAPDVSDSIIQSGALVGKYAIASMRNDKGEVTEKITGKIEEVQIKDGSIYAVIGGKKVFVSDISAISDSELTIPTEPEEKQETGQADKKQRPIM